MEASSLLELLTDKGVNEEDIGLDEDFEPVGKTVLPQKKGELNRSTMGGMDSVQVETKSASMTPPVSRSSVVETEVKQDEVAEVAKDAPTSMKGIASEELMSSAPSRELDVPIEEVMKYESVEDAEEMEGAVDDLDESDFVKQELEPSVVTVSTDADIQTTSKESIVSNRVRSKRKGGLLKGKQSASKPLSSASQDVGSIVESKTFATQSESSYQLPLVVSVEQQNAIQTLRTAEEILVLCDAARPTKSLEILWLSSMHLSTAVSIEVLKVSAEYDHGDVRYLKRNWLRLAMLLRRSGDLTLAEFYESQAATLP